MAKYIYCFDTNILIRLTEYYPKTIFKTLQEKLGEMANQGRLITIEQVMSEYTYDVAGEWFSRHPDIIRAFSEEINEALLILMRDLPGFVDHSKTFPEADQFLVALAMSENMRLNGNYSGDVVLLTQETRKKPASSRLRIPDACDHYGIACFDLLQMMEQESWEF
jgi:hypothetical protein